MRRVQSARSLARDRITELGNISKRRKREDQGDYARIGIRNSSLAGSPMYFLDYLSSVPFPHSSSSSSSAAVPEYKRRAAGNRDAGGGRGGLQVKACPIPTTGS